jgi:uncharacterized membrane protein YqjE
VLETLRKAKKLSAIALERLGDYVALARIELKMQSREIGTQLVGYLGAAVCALFALLFLGVAIVVSFWDSPYRTLAAWAVVALYLAGAATGILLARRHSGAGSGLGTLRDEFQRDVALLRESL